MDDIEACYGTQGNLPSVLEDCTSSWGEGVCTLVNCDEDLTGDPEPETVPALTPIDAAVVCESGREWDLSSGGDTALDAWRTEISADCTIAELADSALDCDPTGDLIRGDACPSGEKLAPPGGVDYLLEIDPAESYVDVDIGSANVFSSLDGSAFVVTGPARVFRLLAWGEDFQYSGDEFTYNHVGLAASVDLNMSSGTFTLPTNQDFELAFQGYQESEEYSIGFAPSESSGGQIDVPNEEWHYD